MPSRSSIAAIAAGSWSTVSASARASRGDVAQLRLEARQPLGERLEPRIDPGDAARLAERDRDALARPATLGGQRLVDRGRPAGDGLAVLGGRQPRADLVRLAGAQARRRDLGRLVLEELQPARELARIDRRARARAARFSRQRSTARRHRGAQRLVPAERVEQVALPALVEEALLVVLAVDLDERPDLVGEPRRGHRRVVEPGGRAAAGGDLAHRDERLRQPVEQRLDAGGLRAVADERGVGARAESRAPGHR